jgi:hypothetical protein
VESLTSWMAVERRERKEKKSMIIVVPSCLKDADGARTRSDQYYFDKFGDALGKQPIETVWDGKNICFLLSRENIS